MRTPARSRPSASRRQLTGHDVHGAVRHAGELCTRVLLLPPLMFTCDPVYEHTLPPGHLVVIESRKAVAIPAGNDATCMICKNRIAATLAITHDGAYVCISFACLVAARE